MRTRQYLFERGDFNLVNYRFVRAVTTAATAWPLCCRAPVNTPPARRLTALCAPRHCPTLCSACKLSSSACHCGLLLLLRCVSRAVASSARCIFCSSADFNSARLLLSHRVLADFFMVPAMASCGIALVCRLEGDKGLTREPSFVERPIFVERVHGDVRGMEGDRDSDPSSKPSRLRLWSL